MHYRVLCLNESSTEDDMKKEYREMSLQSHPDKNNHPQASAVVCMINKAKEGLEDLLRYNDAMKEQEEDIKRQEEAWREDKNLGNYKKKQKNERNKLKWTLV